MAPASVMRYIPILISPAIESLTMPISLTSPRSWLRLAAATYASMSVLMAYAAEPAVSIPAPQSEAARAPGAPQKIVLAGGCFWGVQGVFEHLHGVLRAVSGYAGGDKSTAEYELVSTGSTGHAESVEITYDPQQVTLGDILHVFFSVAHDPTQLNQQGPDRGTQYRSAIFYSDDAQRQLATAYIAQLDKARVFKQPIVTKIDALKGFYPAEAYHQDYLSRHPDQPYIAYNDLPKIREFQRLLPALYVSKPVTVGAL